MAEQIANGRRPESKKLVLDAVAVLPGALEEPGRGEVQVGVAGRGQVTVEGSGPLVRGHFAPALRVFVPAPEIGVVEPGLPLAIFIGPPLGCAAFSRLDFDCEARPGNRRFSMGRDGFEPSTSALPTRGRVVRAAS